ncbi:MAG: response regulator [Deltaproteobacteria bacterium]|nr:response regulator [Deltaproteobacteria bacterium]
MEPGSPAIARPRVLLVDDEPEALRTLTALLTRDYDVVTAPNALAAMQELSRWGCDAVVSDERMPGMSGTRFLGYVRRTYPDTARLILTAYSDSDTLLRAINEGRSSGSCSSQFSRCCCARRSASSSLATRRRWPAACARRSSFAATPSSRLGFASSTRTVGGSRSPRGWRSRDRSASVSRAT